MESTFRQLTSDVLFAELKRGPEGLSEAEAQARLKRLGTEHIPGRLQAWRLIAGFLSNPLVLLLAAAALLLPFTPLGALLGFVPLSWGLLASIPRLTLAYLLVAQRVKQQFRQSTTETS
jgi:hypothetical protein